MRVCVCLCTRGVLVVHARVSDTFPLRRLLNDGITACTAAAFSFTLSFWRTRIASCANLMMSILRQAAHRSVDHIHTRTTGDSAGHVTSIQFVVAVSANMLAMQNLARWCVHLSDVCFGV